MRHITKLCAVLLVLLAPLGCKTTLETPGAYNGDPILYDADLTITTAFAVVDSTLKWEKDNRALLSSVPEIKEACDQLRQRGPGIFKAALRSRDTYAEATTPENANELDIALTMLRALATEAATVIAENGGLNQ